MKPKTIENEINTQQIKKIEEIPNPLLETRSKAEEDNTDVKTVDVDNLSTEKPSRIMSERDIPKGFKKETCECGNTYIYCGLDIGYCVECIDKMTTSDEDSTSKTKTTSIASTKTHNINITHSGGGKDVM